MHTAARHGLQHTLPAVLSGRDDATEVVNMRTHDGATALHLALDCDAADFQHGEVRRAKVRALLAAASTIDFDAVYRGSTVLQFAQTSVGDPEVELMLQRKVRCSGVALMLLSCVCVSVYGSDVVAGGSCGLCEWTVLVWFGWCVCDVSLS